MSLNHTVKWNGTDTRLQSLNEVFSAYEKKHGVKLQVKYTPLEEVEEKLKKNPHDVLGFLSYKWATGKAIVGSPLDNDLYPDWKPNPVAYYV